MSMFERFSDRARQAIVLAQDEARIVNRQYISPEHLLLGVMTVGEGIAWRAMTDLDVSLHNIREALYQKTMRVRGAADSPGHIPFAPNTKLAIEYAMRQALSLNHPYIGTEHLLLGLLALPPEIAEREVAVQLFVERGLSPQAVRAAVLHRLAPPVSVY